MFVMDKVVDEDRRDDLADRDLSEISLPNGTTKALSPSARDAFAVFEDLCLLANAEKPMFLKLESLRKTFALELIESVLTNYHDLYRKVNKYIIFVHSLSHRWSSIQSFSYSYNITYAPCSSKPFLTGRIFRSRFVPPGSCSCCSNSFHSSLEQKQKCSSCY